MPEPDDFVKPVICLGCNVVLANGQLLCDKCKAEHRKKTS
jgi:hypothetical protein